MAGITVARCQRNTRLGWPKKYKTRMAKEKGATGEGGQELTERESLLEELIEISEETDLMMENEDAINKQKSEREVMRSQTTSNPRQITSADLFFFLHAPNILQ